jgi:hypothetical protein
VDERRKYAYRYLLYVAMLDIRGLRDRGRRLWNPFRWWRELRRPRRAGFIADALHNLAIFSAHDFRGFNEDLFWRFFEAICSGFPGCDLADHRETFEQHASSPVEGRPAT